MAATFEWACVGSHGSKRADGVLSMLQCEYYGGVQAASRRVLIF